VSVDEKRLQERAKERTVKTQSMEYDLTTIKNRIESGRIKLDPDYQRLHRWDNVTSSRLVESLLLNIPIPLIYLSQDIDLDEDVEDNAPFYSVIDGQQRLRAIVGFLNNELVLEGLTILDDLNGMKYKDIPAFLKRRLEDRTISCLRIDSTLDKDVKFEIFERLNTGSIELTAQEIRNATYRGPFNDLIKKLAKNEDFRVNTNMTNARESKMFDTEVVLRYFALVNGRYLAYEPLMKTFLNNAMSDFSEEGKDVLRSIEEQFVCAMSDIRTVLGINPFAKLKPGSNDVDGILYASKFNAAVYDAVVIALDNLGGIRGASNNARESLILLFDNQEFQDAISGSVTDVSKLMKRVTLVEDAIRAND
jgi:hypothetical protein